MYHLLSQLPLTVQESNNPVVYSKSILPVWYRAKVVRTECLQIFGTYSIMANVKSDQVRQSIDNLEKYRLFKKNKLKLFIHKEFDQCGSSARSCWKDKCIIYSHNSH